MSTEFTFGLEMNRSLVRITLINIQLVCISALSLFFIVLSSDNFTGHSLNESFALQLLLGFVVIHMFITGVLLYRAKASHLGVIVAYLEVFLLYGLFAWGFYW